MLRAVPSILLLVLVLGASATATVAVPTEFRAVVADATLIARGHVTDVRAVVVPDRGIESVATIAIDTVLKGQPLDFVTIRVPGGDVGRSRAVMVGAPRLSSGEYAVFFLRRGNDNAWRPIGLTMGIYRVHVEALTGRPVVNPPLLAGRTAPVGPVIRGDPQRRPMSVEDFESLIRLVIAGQQVPQGGRR